RDRQLRAANRLAPAPRSVAVTRNAERQPVDLTLRLLSTDFTPFTDCVTSVALSFMACESTAPANVTTPFLVSTLICIAFSVGSAIIAVLTLVVIAPSSMAVAVLFAVLSVAVAVLSVLLSIFL